LLYQSLPKDNVIEDAALDKGYDSDKVRDLLELDGIEAVIPPRSNRKNKLVYDPEKYKERNRIERFFGKLKHYRRCATRYDKYASSFLAFIHIASVDMNIRVLVNTT